MREPSDRVADFFYEIGILQTMKRSGQDFLGSGSQSVADHSFRVAMMGYTLAKMIGCDADKVLKMCMFHDLEESRTGDLNYLQQAYVRSDDEKALRHAVSGLPIEKDVLDIIGEYAAQETMEAVVAKDADVLELLFFLKEQKDKGNQQADNWIRATTTRLKTDLAIQIFQSAGDIMYYEWWYSRDDDESWKRGNKDW
jgi:putative hydrolase of HD superfamily